MKRTDLAPVHIITKRELRKICVDLQIPNWTKPDAQGKTALYKYVADHLTDIEETVPSYEETPTRMERIEAPSYQEWDNTPHIDELIVLPPAEDWLTDILDPHKILTSQDPRDRDESDWPSATWPSTCDLDGHPVSRSQQGEEGGNLPRVRRQRHSHPLHAP